MHLASPSSAAFHFEVLLDHGETANKCTIAPLSYRSDFSIRRFPRGMPIPRLQSAVLLHMDGVGMDQMSPDSLGGKSLSAVDCVWRRLDPIMNWLEKPLPILARIPEGFVTAYPRKSALPELDPSGGLATIEALFIGAAFMGHWDLSILQEYFFADRFLQLNREAFRHYGLGSVAQEEDRLFNPRHPRSAAQRRIGRGRVVRA